MHRACSVAEAARALRINDTTLKEKVEATPPESVMTMSCNRALEKPTFFETRMDAINAMVGEAGDESKQRGLIQIRPTDGTQMNTHHAELTSTELRQLIRGFCG